MVEGFPVNSEDGEELVHAIGSVRCFFCKRNQLVGIEAEIAGDSGNFGGSAIPKLAARPAGFARVSDPSRDASEDDLNAFIVRMRKGCLSHGQASLNGMKHPTAAAFFDPRQTAGVFLRNRPRPGPAFPSLAGCLWLESAKY